jgi:hypothetical protein
MRAARLALIAAVLVLAGCFSPDQPLCAYSCGDTDPKCPDNYVCLSDGYCHLHGDPTACPYSDAAMGDLAMTLPPDMSVPSTIDMASLNDQSTSD